MLVNSEKLYKRFTLSEAVRIQSLLDEFAGSETDVYRQIRNAISSIMIWYVVRAIERLLNELLL